MCTRFQTNIFIYFFSTWTGMHSFTLIIISFKLKFEFYSFLLDINLKKVRFGRYNIRLTHQSKYNRTF